MGNTGAKGILKGLNVNKTLQSLELNGNKVSDEYMKQINDLLNRNKQGEVFVRKIEESPYRKSRDTS